MRSEIGGVHRYCPDPRGVLPLDGVHISRRLARTIRQAVFAADGSPVHVWFAPGGWGRGGGRIRAAARHT